MKKGIVEYLKDYAELKPVRLHMPGHKGAAFFRKYGCGDFLDMMVDGDITEIVGADNKFQADGIIKESMDMYAELYGVKKSYLLVNGTSGGIIASILATVPKGKKLIMARNSHKSVFNALTLADADPVYAYPEIIDEYGISGEIKVSEIESLLEKNMDAAAVILPSPNYYGICSDIEAIAEAVHKAGKLLIVDQAHGAHLKFFSKYGVLGIPRSAEEQGADIVINSTHKTLATFTQSAVMNVNSSRIDLAVLEDKLQAIETTSPSYLLMASHDMNIRIIKEYGEKIFAEWSANIDKFFREVKRIEGIKLLQHERLDKTKLNIDMSALGLTGDMLEEELLEHNIFVELTAGNILMCMTGIGTTDEDITKLLDALSDIAGKYAKRAACCEKTIEDEKVMRYAEANRKTAPGDDKPELCAVPSKKRKVPLSEAAGCICALSVIPYPPGIPIVCPGERITQGIVDYVTVLKKNGYKVIGVTENMEVTVGE